MVRLAGHISWPSERSSDTQMGWAIDSSVTALTNKGVISLAWDLCEKQALAFVNKCSWKTVSSSFSYLIITIIITFEESHNFVNPAVKVSCLSFYLFWISLVYCPLDRWPFCIWLSAFCLPFWLSLVISLWVSHLTCSCPFIWQIYLIPFLVQLLRCNYSHIHEQILDLVFKIIQQLSHIAYRIPHIILAVFA